MYYPMFAASSENVNVSSGSSVLIGEFPTEEPSVEQMKTFVEQNSPRVNATYGFELRGELPPHLIHLSKADDLTGFIELTGDAAKSPAGMKHYNHSLRQAQRTSKEYSFN